MTTSDATEAHGGSLPPNSLPTPPDEVPAGTEQSALFGRGLLYVLVFSFQTLAATIISPVLAHLIGPTEFGRLASAIALFQLLSVLCLVGLDQALVLQRAEDGHSRAARGLITVSFAITTVVVLVAGLTSPLWSEALGFGPFSQLLLATFLWTGPGAAVQVTLALLLAEDRLKIFTVVSALSAVGGQLVGVALLLLGQRDATTYAWGGVISQSIALLLGVIVTRPRLRGLVELAVARRAIRLGAPLAIGAMSSFVLSAGDRIVIQRLLGATEVGRYQVAYVVGFVVVMLMVYVSQAWAPRLAAMRDRGERLALAGAARNHLYQLLMPMLAGLTLGAPVALRIFAPESFDPGTLTLVTFLVALSAFPVAANSASGRELVILRRGRAVAAVALTAAAVNIGLNFALIPVFGLEGSALATVLAFTLSAVLQVRLLPRGPGELRWPGVPPRLVAMVVLTCALCTVSTVLPQTLEWNVGRIVVALACVPWLLSRLKKARDTDAPAPVGALTPEP